MSFYKPRLKSRAQEYQQGDNWVKIIREKKMSPCYGGKFMKDGEFMEDMKAASVCH